MRILGTLLHSSCLVLLALPHAAVAARFEALDFFPSDVSGDGRIVVGEDRRWSTEVGDLPGIGVDGRLIAVDYSGRRIVGRMSVELPGGGNPGTETFVWDELDGVSLSGIVPGRTGAYPSAISSDGAVIVGIANESAYDEFYVWTYGQDVIRPGIPHPESDGRKQARDVSDIGSVVVGRCCGYPSEREAFRWDPVRGASLLPGLPGVESSEALAVSADASTIVGRSGGHAVRWNAAGEVEALAPLGEFDSAYGLSANGEIIYGTGPAASGVRTILRWTASHGAEDVRLLLQVGGELDLMGWELRTLEGVSADGNTIVGWGTNPQGVRQGFLAVIPEPGTAVLVGIGLAGLAMTRRGPAA